ncbi:hypothetical protein PX701_10140 [Agromyces sp. H3Y2-19a]|uniref:hypothetical protein n=1 Tax=Agromyces TaxID=33877 RepID=UPI001E4FB3FC|nr:MULTISPECIES: hypothetical protein [Agromyces]MCD5344839.1 hypothetical protein [Agromyces sp. S2-1-8]MDF0513978.1 hypothetical protein [Agromyces chromiiresistens]
MSAVVVDDVRSRATIASNSTSTHAWSASTSSTNPAVDVADICINPATPDLDGPTDGLPVIAD